MEYISELIAVSIVGIIFLLSRWYNIKLSNNRHQEIKDDIQILLSTLISQNKKINEISNKIEKLSNKY